MSKSIAHDLANSYESWDAILGKIQDNLCDVLLNAGTLAIGTAKAKVLLTSTVYAVIDGALVTKTTAETVLSGTVVNATFNVFVLTLNAAGTITATMGTAGATLGAVVWPTIPADQVVLGFVIVNPTGTGNFVGGTTDLDDAVVVPAAVYINTPYPFNPNSLSL